MGECHGRIIDSEGGKIFGFGRHISLLAAGTMIMKLHDHCMPNEAIRYQISVTARVCHSNVRSVFGKTPPLP